MTVFLQGIPDTIEDRQKMSYIRRTIEEKDMKEALQTCKTSTDMLNTIAGRHVDDKNIIGDLFKPVYAARNPTNYVICYKNIEIILKTLSLFQTIGMMSRVQVHEYDECLKKAFHKERKQKWMDHSATSRPRIGQQGEVADADKLYWKNEAW